MEFLLLERKKEEIKKEKWYFIQVPKERASERIRGISKLFLEKPLFLKRAKPSKDAQILMVLLFSDQELQKDKESINTRLEGVNISLSEVEEIDIPVEDPEEEELRKKACEIWPCSFHPVKKPHLSNDTLRRVRAVLEAEALEEDSRECSLSACILMDNSYEKFSGDTAQLFHHPVLSLIQETSRKTEGYLCTNRIAMVSSEPCLVCGMALLHARIKKVFIIGSASCDAPYSSHYLHDISQLNHRFLVYFGKSISPIPAGGQKP